MEGVTTALIGFIFVCVVYPQLIKTRPQFYAALGFVCLIILLDALARMSGSAGFVGFIYAVNAFLQVGAILLLFLAAGGLTWRQLAGDMGNAIEVIRRGGEKEVIVPITGAVPKPRAARAEPTPERIVINDPPAKSRPPAVTPTAAPAVDEKIPLE
jgi:hypothetical protein